MKTKHKASSSLNAWSVILLTVGIIGIAVAIFAFLAGDNKSATTILNFALLSIVVSVLFDGLKPIVAAAEKGLAEPEEEETH